MHRVKGAFIIICLCSLIFSQTIFAQEKLFSAEELKSDLQFYKNKLEQYHPGLYLYTSKKEVDHYFDSLNTLINKPLSELEFYKIIALSSSVVKDGHTLILPNETTRELYNANNKFLPYQLAIINNELYVKFICTGDKTISEGAKIISINGVAGSDIINQLMERQVRDGNNLAYPGWILNTYFREYYSYVFGHPASFEIAYIQGVTPAKATIPALAKDSIYFYRKEHYPSVNFDKPLYSALTLQWDKKNNNYTLLTIKDFHNDILRNIYKQNFEKTIAAFMDSIIESKTNNLIIDLRNNQGGDIENGVFLLSYLLSKPFKVVKEYNCLKNGEAAPCSGPSAGLQQPKQKTYTGNLYVLINGGSFSNSAIVASCLQVNKRAIFIGTQTGGNPNVLTGFPKDFELPNTKIYVEIPVKQFIMTSKEQNNGYGLQPDYSVVPGITDILHQTDTELNFVLKLIEQNESEKN